MSDLIHLIGGNAYCPNCSGLLKPVSVGLSFQCFNCQKRYEVKGIGKHSEREFVVEDVGKSEVN